MTGKPILTIRPIFAAAVIVAGMLAGAGYEAHRRSELAAFNPVKDFLAEHRLLEALKRDPYGKAICNFDAGIAQNPVVAKHNQFMLTYDLCNAAGHPAFAKNKYNDKILNPPPGQTSEDVMREFRSVVAAEMKEMCIQTAKQPNPNDRFMIELCRAEGHPVFQQQ